MTPASPSGTAASSRFRLRTYLVAIVLAVCVPFIGFQAYEIARESEARHAEAATVSYHIARAIAGEIAQFVRSNGRALAFLSARPLVRALDPATCDPMISVLRASRDRIANVLTVDLEGRLLCSATAIDPARPQRVDPKYWLERLRSTGQPVIGTPARGFVTGLWVVTLAHPVRDESGKLAGAAAMALDLARFRFGDEGLEAPPETTITILTAEGVVIARSAEAAAWVGREVGGSDVVRAVLAQRSGTLRSAGLDGVARDYGFTPVPGTPWFVLAGTPAAAANVKVLDAMFRLSLAAGMTLVLAALTAWLLARRISRPVKQIALTARAVAAGEGSVRAMLAGPREIAEVAAQFNAMLDAQRESTDRLQLAMQAADLYPWDWHIVSDRLHWGRDPSGLLGAPGPASRAYPDFRELVHPEDRERFLAAGRAALAGEAPYEIDFRLSSRSGALRWLHARGVVVRDAAGAPRRMLGVTLDVTRRKLAEEALRRSETELRLLNESLERRIAERTRELSEAKEAAESASRAKSEFLANMSHELRTPLNAIIGFSEMLKDGALGGLEERQRGFASDIFNAGTHLLQLINDILDLSKVEAGMMRLETGTVDVATLLHSAPQVVRDRAAAQRIRMTTGLEPGLGALVLDERKLKQILYNLLSNAVKFTPPDGAVTLRARRCARDEVRLDESWPGRLLPLPPGGDAEFLAVTVEDTGGGIAEADLPRLFEPFVQVDSSLSRRHGGSGLGLSLVRKLAELQGGTVGVSSRPGAGSRFCVWLPYRKPDIPPPGE